MARILQQNNRRFYSQIWQELFINGGKENGKRRNWKMMREACESYIQDYDFRYLVKEVVREKIEGRVKTYVDERIDEEIKKF